MVCRRAPRRPVSLADEFAHTIHQRVAAQHHYPGIEQRPVFFRQAVTHVPLECQQLLLCAFQGGLEPLQFQFGALPLPIRYQAEVCRWIDHHRVSDGDAIGTRPTLQEAVVESGIRRLEHFPAGLGVGNGPGQLGRKGQQQVDLVILETAPLDLTHHEDPEHLPVLDDRRAKEAVVLGFAGLHHAQVALVRGRIVEIEGLCPFTDQSYQPPEHGQAHLAHGLGAKAVGGHQNVLAGVEIGQVDRADIGPYRALDATDDGLEGIVEIPRRADLLDDAAQRIENAGLSGQAGSPARSSTLLARAPARGSARTATRRTLREDQRRQFPERAAVDASLEVDDAVGGVPVPHPAPVVELRFLAPVETKVRLVAKYAQHEPALFLADAKRVAVAANEAVRKPVAEPVAGHAKDFHLIRLEAHFLAQFPVHGLFGRFVVLDAALGELPRILAHAPAPEKAPFLVAEDDAHVGAKTVPIDHGFVTMDSNCL